MDPTATLLAAREALARYEEAYRECSTEENMAADDLAEAFENLDSWLSKGGFLPAPWQFEPSTST